MREYDLIADWYPTDRSRTFGVAEALAVAAPLPAHSRILDVGCGNGVPITKALVNAGHCVVGLDSSAGMLARFRVNLPGTLMVRGDARQCPFVDGSFDAAISWGMIFHLPPADQAAVFAVCHVRSSRVRRFSSQRLRSMALTILASQAR